MIGNGFFPLSVTSIQRQFGYSSRTVGGLASIYDCVVGVVSLVVAQFFSNAHTPRILGRAMVLQGVGAALFLLPVFVGPEYNPQGGKGTQLCGSAQPAPACAEDVSLGYYFVFVLGMVLLGIASPPIYNIGLTFFDDNTRPERTSTHMALFFVAATLGPAVGYVLGGAFLDIFVLPYVDPQVDASSSAWVGAWWLGYALAGGLSLLLAPLFFCIPRELPGLAWVRRFRRAAAAGGGGGGGGGRALVKGEDAAAAGSAGGAGGAGSAGSAGPSRPVPTGSPTLVPPAQGPEAELGPGPSPASPLARCRAALADLRGLLGNPAYIGVVIGNYADIMLVTGVGAFLPAVVESQFHLTSATASLLAGGAIIGGGTVGTLVGGLLMRWRRWSPKETARAIVVCSLLTIAFFGAFFVQCDSLGLAGVNTAFPAGAPSPPRNASTWQGCDASCGCDSRAYQPVCYSEVQLTFFSPCAAGCSAHTADAAQPSGYLNCSCAGLNATTAVLRAGKCQGDCHHLGLFLALLFVAVLFALFAAVPGVHITMRCVEERHRSLALSFATFCSRILGSTFSPLILGIILDGTCELWDTTCSGARGSCLEYDNASMALHVFYCVVAAKALATLGWLLAWVYFPPERDVPFDSSAKFEQAEAEEG